MNEKKNLLLYGNSCLCMLGLTFLINYSNIDGITGFSEEDSQSVLKFMQSAVELAKSNDLVSVQIFSFSNNLWT